MDFLFSAPQSPRTSLGSGRKRRGSVEESWILDTSLGTDDIINTVSSPKGLNSNSPHRSFTDLGDSNVRSHKMPGWATPPKSPKSPKSARDINGFNYPSPLNSPSVKSPRRVSGGFEDHISTTNSPLSDRKEGADRFIPDRNRVDIDLAAHLLSSSNENSDSATFTKTSKVISGTSGAATRTHLGVISNANNVGASHGRLMSCFNTSKVGISMHDDGFSRLKDEKVSEELTAATTTAVGAAAFGAGVLTAATSSPSAQRSARHIPSQASRILDAPDLMDDYYLNLLSWSQQNVIAVALNQSVYLWHAADGHIDSLLTLEGDDYVTSVQWSNTSDNTLAVGTSGNVVQLWDAAALHKVRDMTGHNSRVSSLSWNGSSNPSLLSSGSRDATILNHDIRAARNVQGTLCGHSQEICGLSWSPDGSLLASGGNENRLCIWDAAMSRARTGGAQSGESSPRYTIDQHNAAVKAVAWCPWQRNVLASGGGTADRTIRIWNAATGTNLRTMDTGSQVCAIQWSLTEKELVSSHGFSDNQIILWKYGSRQNSLTKIRELHGHTSRVLHLALSPDGATVCSASADETIRFWDVFGPSAATVRKISGSPQKAAVGTSSSPLSRNGHLFNFTHGNDASNSLHVR